MCLIRCGGHYNNAKRCIISGKDSGYIQLPCSTQSWYCTTARKAAALFIIKSLQNGKAQTITKKKKIPIMQLGLPLGHGRCGYDHHVHCWWVPTDRTWMQRGKKITRNLTRSQMAGLSAALRSQVRIMSTSIAKKGTEEKVQAQCIHPGDVGGLWDKEGQHPQQQLYPTTPNLRQIPFLEINGTHGFISTTESDFQTLWLVNGAIWQRPCIAMGTMKWSGGLWSSCARPTHLWISLAASRECGCSSSRWTGVRYVTY